VVFGAGDKLLNVFAQLQQNFPFVPLASSQAQFQPVWVEDVAQAVVNVLQGSRYENNSVLRSPDHGIRPKIYEIAGTKVWTLRQLFELAGRCVGASRPVFPLPQGLARIQAAVMEHLPGPTLMSRDNLDSMKSPNIASGAFPGLIDLGIEPTGVEAVAPLYLQPASRLDQFRKAAAR
jgi:NADH dehydrogenase